MKVPLRRRLLALLFVGMCLSGAMASAETGVLIVHVEDVQGHPVRGVEIGVKGDGGSAVSDPHGTVRIRLAPQTQVKDWVTLQVMHSPVGKDLVLLSPWDSRALVPSFENKSDNYVDLVVVESGDRAALASPAALRALAEKINQANAPKSADKFAAQDPKANLDAVANQYGLSSDDLDKAIRAWGAKTNDPYDVGLAALYARNYDAATSNLKDSLKQREEKLAADKKTDEKAVADAAFFLGQSQYEQGNYKESATSFLRCLQIRADDPLTINNAALSLKDSGAYAEAEPLYRRAIVIGEKTLGPDNPNVATGLHNLGALLQAREDYAGAEQLYRQALTIHERTLGPDSPIIAMDLYYLGLLLIIQGNNWEGEYLVQRRLAINARDALRIDEKALGPDHPSVARDLDNLAGLLYITADYASAEPLSRRALAIDEKALGADHPATQVIRSHLNLLLKKMAQTTPPKPQN